MGNIVDMEGFNGWGLTDQTLYYTGNNFNWAPAGRYAPQAIGFQNAGSVENYRDIGVNVTAFQCAFNVFISAAAASDTFIVAFSDVTTNNLMIELTTGGVLRVSRNGTVLGTGTTNVGDNAWHLVQFRAVIDNTIGEFILYVDGAIEITGSGADTQGGANSYFNRYYFRSIGFGRNIAWNDFYIEDDNGNPGVMPPLRTDRRVTTLTPSGAGNYAQWTGVSGANYANADTNDGDTSYNASNTTGQRDSFAYDDVTGALGIDAVRVVTIARRDDTGTVEIQPMIRIAGTNYDGTAQTFGTSYERMDRIYNDSPATSINWDVAELNAAEFGYRASNIA